MSSPTYMQDGREARYARAPEGGFVVTGSFGDPFPCGTETEAEDVCRLWAFNAISPYSRQTLTELQPID
jgi:hypothetical protein